MGDERVRLSSLQRDDELTFPHFYVVSASAGSGKTYTLSIRFCQFLLSTNISNNALPNIIALTFTKNAANEMKQRILEWLKKINLGLLNEPDKKNLTALLYDSLEDIMLHSEKAIDLIFENFSEFQVSTIDSFMAKIFRVLPFETNILANNIKIDSDEIFDFAIDRLIQEIEFQKLEEYLRINETNNIINFNPKEEIKKNLLDLLNLENKKLGYFKENKNIEPSINEVKRLMKYLASLAEQGLKKGLALNGKIHEEKFIKLIDKLNNPEINIVGIIRKIYKSFPFNKEKSDIYSHLKKEWDASVHLIYGYLPILCQVKYQQYINLFTEFKSVLQGCYNELGSIYIGNINKLIFENLDNNNIIKVQFCLGSHIYHMMIDEFQDTDEVQWGCLKRFCDDLMTRNGSMFAVGDIKQSIYSFRGADYKIMKETIDKPMKNTYLLNLENNFRSDGVLIESIRKFFQEDIFDQVSTANNLSGLSDYLQFPLEERSDLGFFKTQVAFFDNTGSDDGLEDGLDDDYDLRTKLLNLLSDLNKRFKLSDIAILTRSNSQVNEISSWLLEGGYSIVSESSLDIRDRKIIQEIISLLKFIESPADNLNFSTFLLSKVMEKILLSEGISLNEIREFLFINRDKNIYTAFKDNYIEIWNKYLREIYLKSGYIPIYNLLILIFSTFKISFNFPEESAYLVKFLEIVTEIESSGYVDINNLLQAVEREKTDVFKVEISGFGDAIRLMTIHKAKGLEFPVVINIVDAESSFGISGKNRSISNLFVLNEDDIRKTGAPTNESLSLLHITKDLSEKNDLLGEVFYNEEVNCMIDDLNLLYVAMTRARHELYNFLCFRKEKTLENVRKLVKEIGSINNFINTSSKNARLTCLTFAQSFLRDPLREEKNWKKEDIESIRRGVLIHKILEQIKFREDLVNLDKIIQIYKKDVELFDEEVMQKIFDVVSNEKFQRYFSNESKIYTEVDFVDKRGRVFRIDRLVVDRDTIYVVDYKTGIKEYYKNLEKEKYYKQIRQYMKIIYDVYKKDTIGVILDIDNLSEEIVYKND
ncbi:UvrD-helicase domain-containing protein [Thermodesulfobium sp. 4217-1]|uniref:UvrD-helicase domain-containing protein n=1 Tax=Thermodesulfobium sp. 4217-1 TaxID=3120013 RepID=UPI003221AC3F